MKTSRTTTVGNNQLNFRASTKDSCWFSSENPKWCSRKPISIQLSEIKCLDGQPENGVQFKTQASEWSYGLKDALVYESSGFKTNSTKGPEDLG